MTHVFQLVVLSLLCKSDTVAQAVTKWWYAFDLLSSPTIIQAMYTDPEQTLIVPKCLPQQVMPQTPTAMNAMTPTLVILAVTHWGRVTHICVTKLNTIGSCNGLWPGRRQAIIWTNAGILLIGPLEPNFSEIFLKTSYNFIQGNAIENVVCEIAPILSRLQWC